MSKFMVRQDDLNKTISRFWLKVDIGSDDDCWEWLACKNPKGYGQFQYEKSIQQAHRVSYMINIGKIPDGLFVLHNCDNPSCVNPNHLFLGTNQDNVQDKVNKNRVHHPKGELNGRSKLTKKDIRTIRKLYASGNYFQYQLGEMFGVTQPTIGSIVNNQTWK